MVVVPPLSDTPQIWMVLVARTPWEGETTLVDCLVDRTIPAPEGEIWWEKVSSVLGYRLGSLGKLWDVVLSGFVKTPVDCRLQIQRVDWLLWMWVEGMSRMSRRRRIRLSSLPQRHRRFLLLPKRAQEQSHQQPIHVDCHETLLLQQRLFLRPPLSPCQFFSRSFILGMSDFTNQLVPPNGLSFSYRRVRLRHGQRNNKQTNKPHNPNK